MLFPQILIIMKNFIIAILAVFLVASCVVINHLTNRLDDARAYINDFEETYPDFLDTVAEGDAYSEWYCY